MDRHQPASDRATAPSWTVRQEIAAIKAEHHVSETSAYGMLVRAAIAA